MTDVQPDPQKNRIDLYYLFDATMSNPNGDPDSLNWPRIDPETMRGLVTDTCIKRKIRDYVALTREGQAGYDIYVKQKGILHDSHRRAYQAVGASVEPKTKGPKKFEADSATLARDWMCKNFFDVRTFGAVMSTGVNAGQVRGPVQFDIAKTFDPVAVLDVAGVRVAANEARDFRGEDLSAGDDTSLRDSRRNSRMYRHSRIRYGLYEMHGYITPAFARQTGFSQEDLAILIESLQNLFAFDRSRVRPNMVARQLILFDHASTIGNAQAYKLFDKIQVKLRNDRQNAPITGYHDYEITMPDLDKLPPDVRMHTYLG